LLPVGAKICRDQAASRKRKRQNVDLYLVRTISKKHFEKRVQPRNSKSKGGGFGQKNMRSSLLYCGCGGGIGWGKKKLKKGKGSRFKKTCAGPSNLILGQGKDLTSKRMPAGGKNVQAGCCEERGGEGWKPQTKRSLQN